MRYKKIVIPSLILIMTIGLLPMQSQARMSTKSTSALSTISVDITFANYTDLDGDGYQDDVYATIDVNLDRGEAYTFDYYISLTLPSGIAFSYLYVVTTNYESFTIHNYFWDSALESGWYELDVKVQLYTGGGQTDASNLVFDPPGGSSGGDPDHGMDFSG